MRSRLAVLIGLALVATQVPGRTTTGALPVGEARDRALRYVHDHHASLGLSNADISGLQVTDAYRSRATKISHVYLRQTHRTRPVLGTSMTLGLLDDGTVFHAARGLLHNLSARVSGTRGISGARALANATAALSTGRVARAPHLVYQALDDGRVRLAWNLELDLPAVAHWWNVSVDAESGELLTRIDYVDHDAAMISVGEDGKREPRPIVGAPERLGVDDGSSYRVFALPLESPNDGERQLVTNPADPEASPWGWHDTNGAPGAERTTTHGNNVYAYADITAASVGLPLMDPDGGSGLDFDFPIDPSLPPLASKDAAVTNLFYINNMLHDIYYRYGFDEWGGNFQTNTYGRGGKDNDEVQAEGQDSSGTSNANFATPVDGSKPRMQMYLWPHTGQKKLYDGDLDNSIIIHEYTHGLSNRLTGGPGNSSCLRNSEQAGEGWSDFMALALTVLPGDTGAMKRGMGTYVLGQGNRDQAGIRPRQYRTTSTTPRYDDIKSQAIPHGVGWVWANMVWDLYWALTDTYGFNPDVYGDWTTGGNNLAIQLVIEGLALQKCSPGFADARDGILAAEAAITGGVNECLIWKTFARRGLGVSATQGSSASVTDGKQAFDVPGSCPA